MLLQNQNWGVWSTVLWYWNIAILLANRPGHPALGAYNPNLKDSNWTNNKQGCFITFYEFNTAINLVCPFVIISFSSFHKMIKVWICFYSFSVCWLQQDGHVQQVGSVAGAGWELWSHYSPAGPWACLEAGAALPDLQTLLQTGWAVSHYPRDL